MAKKIFKKLLILFSPLLAVVALIAGGIYWGNYVPGIDTIIVVMACLIITTMGILAEAAYHERHGEIKTAWIYFSIFIVMAIVFGLFITNA